MNLKKHPFVLFEVFLALAIVAIALLPLTSYPYQYFAKEKRILQSIQRQRLYDVSYAQVLDMLGKSIAFESITQESPLELTLSPQTVGNKITPCQATILLLKPKEEEQFTDNKQYKLISCELKIGEHSQKRKLLVHTT